METTWTQFFIPVLSIAGSDPSGGAGIQQDIKTCEALGCYGMAAITALTAQSPSKVSKILSVSDFLKAQLTALLDEVRPSAVKIGMLPDAKSVKIVTDAIIKYDLKNIVVDPVMVSTSGHMLTDQQAIEAMKKCLFPLSTLLTPNIPEANILGGFAIETEKEAMMAAYEIINRFGSTAVLIKGGHSKSMYDTLYVPASGQFRLLPTKKVDTPNTHGTGCRLSTAIACGLAKGLDITTAVTQAKEWLTDDLCQNSNMRFPLP